MMPLLSDDILQSLWFSCCRYNFQASVNAVLTQFIFLVTPSLHSSSFWWHFLAQFLIFLMTLPYTIPLLSDGTALHNSSSFWWHFLTQFLFFLMTLPYTIPHLSDDTSLHNFSSFWWHFLTQFLFFLMASVYAILTQFLFMVTPSLHCSSSLWWHLPYTIPLLSDSISLCCPYTILYTILLSDETLWSLWFFPVVVAISRHQITPSSLWPLLCCDWLLTS